MTLGLGVFYGIQEVLNIPKFCEKFKLSPGVKGKTVIVQGIGNVGYWAAKFFMESEAILIGLVEYNSAIYNPAGINVEEAFQYFRSKGSFKDYPKATEVMSEANCMEVMYKECDILIPAAIENSVTKFNVERVKTKLLGEAANGPTTFAADKYLTEHGIPIIPDFILNAGGVTVSYFEWLKNLEHSQLGRLNKGWQRKANEAVMTVLGIDIPETSSLKEGPSEKQIVYSALQEAMSSAIREIFNRSLEHNCSMRVAGYRMTIERIAKSIEDAGIF